MQHRLEELDKMIESVETLMAEHESDPTGAEYTSLVDHYTKLMEVRKNLVELDLKKEETMRKLNIQERELESKVEEMMARVELDWYKIMWTVGGAIGSILLVDFLESHGHLIRETGLRLWTTGVKAITNKL